MCWETDLKIERSLISLLHVNIIQLFVSFVVIDLINDSICAWDFAKLADQTVGADDRCHHLANTLYRLQRSQHKRMLELAWNFICANILAQKFILFV